MTVTHESAATRKPNDLESFWLPFTPNRAFKRAPRLVVRAKDMHYYTDDGRAVLDGTAGLWCSNAGHSRDLIVAAIQRQAEQLDYAPTFQFAHPQAFELASRIAALAPAGLDRVFFCNSGSEAVDTALKIALAYHHVRGDGARTRLIGRERGYHGVGFGGLSVGGIVNNRRAFATHLPGVDHISHTHDLARNAFSKGLPAHGAELADDVERLVALHGSETIAAVIVEPVAGSTGVLLPPQGYLQRLRALCDKHGILLIFDEVITGFGRLGTPFAADYFGVTPDLIASAKGLTNGTVPMGTVFASRKIHDAMMVGPENQIELFHGYTYSAHPVACAAGIATLEIYQRENLLTRGAALTEYWQGAMHSLKDSANVIDIRAIGLVAGIELSSRPDAPGSRAYDIMVDCFNRGLVVRVTGDTLALSPPLIVERAEIDEMVMILSDAIKRAA